MGVARLGKRLKKKKSSRSCLLGRQVTTKLPLVGRSRSRSRSSGNTWVGEGGLGDEGCYPADSCCWATKTRVQEQKHTGGKQQTDLSRRPQTWGHWNERE